MSNVYYCRSCGHEDSCDHWCPSCREYGTRAPLPPRPVPQPILSTGMVECDRMLGGGLRESMVYLLFGEPGCGKSTLAGQWCAAVGGTYVSTEQSESAVRELLRRVTPHGSKRRVRVISRRTIPDGLRAAGDAVALVLDSISGLGDSHAASLANVKTAVDYSRKFRRPVVVISHVNKSGALAGLKSAEHAVDGVLRLEGSGETKARRLVPVKLRGQKPRSVGLTLGDRGFEEGYQELLALDRGTSPVIGSVLAPTLAGRGVRLVEVCAAAAPGRGRVLADRIAVERVKRLVATLCARWPGLAGPLKKRDLTVSAEDEATDPQADAAIALAILSAITATELDPITVTWGAVPLVGAVRLDESWDDRADLARRLPTDAKIIDPAGVRDISELWAAVSSHAPEIPGESPDDGRTDAGA